MLLIAQVFGAVAGVCWFVAAASGLMLSLNHRQEDRGLEWYAVNGHAFYSASNFAASGADLHKRMVWGIGGFVVSGGVGGLILFLTLNTA